MTASNGAQGCRRARETQPAVVLLDVNLPDIDGGRLSQKADDRTKHIPVVILTARDEPHGTRRAKLECAAYLKRPRAPPDLVSVLKRVIEEQQAV